MESTCEWDLCFDRTTYQTKCGEFFTNMTPPLLNSNYKHCPNCGKLIDEYSETNPDYNSMRPDDIPTPEDVTGGLPDGR